MYSFYLCRMNKVANFLLKRSLQKREFSTPLLFSQIKEVLILTDKSTIELNSPWKEKSKILFYSEKNDTLKDAILLSKEDFNWMGKCKNEEIEKILNKNYDLFIDFHSEPSPFIEYFYHRLNAQCKVSNKMEDWVDLRVEKPFNKPNEYFTTIEEIVKKFQ